VRFFWQVLSEPFKDIERRFSHWTTSAAITTSSSLSAAVI
jgi:hypothetical protein